MWMCSLRRLQVAKKHNFGQFLILGASVPTLFADESQIWCHSRPKDYTYTPNFVWMCSLCRLPVAKNHKFGQILTFWGLLYQSPVTDEGQLCCVIANLRCTLTRQILSRSVYCVTLCWRKTPIFAVFWTSAFSGVANWQQSEKSEHGCITTNLPLSNGIEIVSVFQRLHGKIRRTISDV